MVFKCKICGKSFEKQQHYAGHFVIHKREKERRSIWLELLGYAEKQVELLKELERIFNEIKASQEKVNRELELMNEQLQRVIQILTFPKEE